MVSRSISNLINVFLLQITINIVRAGQTPPSGQIENYFFTIILLCEFNKFN